MTPVTPVIPDKKLREFTFAEHQDQYENLPTYKYDDAEGTVLSRWKLSWRERLRILFTGDMYLRVMTFNRPLQPVMLQVEKPDLEKRDV